MEQKTIHYDGSGQPNLDAVNKPKEPFQMTDEVRKNIGFNPYSIIED